MKIVRVSSVVLVGALMILGATTADAQHGGHSGGHRGGGHNRGGHNSGGHNSGSIYGGGHNSGGHYGGSIYGGGHNNGGHLGGGHYGGNIYGGNIYGGGHNSGGHNSGGHYGGGHLGGGHLGGGHLGGIHHGSTYVLPHLGGHHYGSYYVQDGHSYYYPQTATTGYGHTTAYRPQQIQFGAFSHVEDLSARLITLANDLCLDLHYNYPHNPGFDHTYQEAYQILEVAKYMHAAEHQHDRVAIRERLGGADQLFHHVQGEVRGWTLHHHRQIGQLDLLARMDLIEATLHHLMNDVGVSPAPVAGGGQPPRAAGAPVQAVPPSGALPTFQSPVPPTAP